MAMLSERLIAWTENPYTRPDEAMQCVINVARGWAAITNGGAPVDHCAVAKSCVRLAMGCDLGQPGASETMEKAAYALLEHWLTHEGVRHG